MDWYLGQGVIQHMFLTVIPLFLLFLLVEKDI